MPLGTLRKLIVAASLLVVGVGSAGCLAPIADNSGPTTCSADDFESNDTQETARDLGRLRDDPDSQRGITATVHHGDDADWYRVHVSDTGLGGDPNVAVTVPEGFSVSTWFVCDHGRVETTCLHGSSEYMTVEGVEGCRGSVPEPVPDENGNTIFRSDLVAASTTDCSGTSDDDGTLFIRVERSTSSASTCAYGVAIAVD